MPRNTRAEARCRYLVREIAQQLVIPLDYANADWLPKAVQDTADIRKRQR